MRRARHSGFTLFEMVMVLVIVSLIAGGIFVGGDLIQAAKLRKVASEVDAIRTAVANFKLKYDGWPGDFGRAAAYWPGTVDGNNNNVLSVQAADGNYAMGDGDDGPEYLYAWQHLSLAGMIEGTYGGRPDAAAPAGYAAGVNMPPTRYSGQAGYVIWDNGGTQGMLYLPNAVSARSDKFLILGNQFDAATSNWQFYGGAVLPMDAFAIDVKMDDGRAATGNVVGFTGTTADIVAWYANGACSSSILAPTTADYDKLSTQLACVMIFSLEY